MQKGKKTVRFAPDVKTVNGGPPPKHVPGVLKLTPAQRAQRKIKENRLKLLLYGPDPRFTRQRVR